MGLGRNSTLGSLFLTNPNILDIWFLLGCYCMVWFSRFEESVFRFGEIHITCTGAPGWDADISMEDGVPLAIRDFSFGWGEPIVTLTRIV